MHSKKTTRLMTGGVVVWMAWSAAAAAGPLGVKILKVVEKVDVVIATRSGDVDIVGWDRKEMKVESEQDLGNLIRVEDQLIRVGAGPKEKHAGVLNNDVTVHLPASLQVTVRTLSGDLSVKGMKDRVKLTTVSGDVRVRACHGPVELRSTSGEIVVDEVKNDLSIDGVSGDVKVRDVKGSILEAKTVSGEITLRAVQVKKLSLKTVSGDILVQGSFPADGTLRTTSMSGDVTIVLPLGAGFDVSAKTHSGSIRSAFELKSGDRSEHRLQGKVGAGGVSIGMKSFSGDLKIRADK